MAVVGFDFGTTNSLISIVKGDRAITYLDNDGLPTPSVVCFEGIRKIVGHEAKERLAEAGLGIKGNIVRSPKMLLGRESVFVEGVERSPVDIVAEVIRFVTQQAVSSQRVKGLENIQRAVVTIPVNMEGYRRAALRDAFRKAGINIVQFIHEPLAALYGYFRSEGRDYSDMLRQYDRKYLVVFDWGGGTLDLNLCKLIDGMLVQVKNDGTDDVGGDAFDDMLKNEVVRRFMKSMGIEDSAKVQPDAMMRLLHRCELAKIDLSTRNSVELYVPSFFHGIPNDELDYTLRREDLEEMSKALLDKGLSRIDTLLEAANISSAQVSLCLATGGMTNMPAIKARLHERFGPQRVHVAERTGSLISEGAAWVANDKAKLVLAKNVELLLSRNSPMTLIKAGTEMPREGEVRQNQFHLYCSDPRDGFAKLQIQVPLRPGLKVLPNDQRKSLHIMVVEVDSQARPFRERLELDISIDDNLILNAQARSLNKMALDEAEVHDLEFGLSLKRDHVAGLDGNICSVELSEFTASRDEGELVMRSNITKDHDKRMIPGELLNSYDPHYFDVRQSPPEIQVEECLYYEPCCVCGRASNDPLCSCGPKLTLPDAQSV